MINRILGGLGVTTVVVVGAATTILARLKVQHVITKAWQKATISRRITVALVIIGLVAMVPVAAKVANRFVDARIAKSLRLTQLAAVPVGTMQGAAQVDLGLRLGAVEGQNLAVRVDALERMALAGVDSKADNSVVAGDYVGAGAIVFAMLDAVGPYRKNGLFEVYGGSLRERRSGPIRVANADFEISHDEAWLIWSPDHSPARDATHLEVAFAALPAAGKMTIGFVFNDGQAVAIASDLGPAKPAPTGLLAPLLPEDISDRANKAQMIVAPKPVANNVVVALPAGVMAKLRKGQKRQIVQWFVRVTGAAGTTLQFKHLALIRPSPAPTSAGVTLAGHVSTAGLPPGVQLELLTETGGVTKQSLASDGGFVFANVDPAAIISLRLRHHELNRYATLGRWFVAGYARKDLRIDLQPHYLNSDGHAPDPTKAKFVGPRVASPVSALYEPHARQYWPGGSTVQEYDSTTFTNNHGYLDRDRFFDNPDNCVRVASTGGSDMVSLQVRPYEKFNIFLEESLGIALGKCVEVISAGADNGDLGTNYPRIRDYTSKFKVAHTIVSMASGLVYQVNPQMLKDGLGMDPENSALPNFFFDKKGLFSFRGASPAYPVFMTKPTHPEYVKGIPFSYTLSVPFDAMPSQGKEAFRYWTEIVNYIERQHPGQNFIFHTGIDQAQCRKNCETTLQLDNGKKVSAGAKVYVSTLSEYCAANTYKCIHPQFSDAYGEKPSLLTFEFDSHYSPLGHQWLAQELTAPLAKILSAAAVGTAQPK